jgi:hypothetical protein
MKMVCFDNGIKELSFAHEKFNFKLNTANSIKISPVCRYEKNTCNYNSPFFSGDNSSSGSTNINSGKEGYCKKCNHSS